MFYTQFFKIKFGADPEFFFTDKETGEVVGAEKVLDKEGTYMTRPSTGELYDYPSIIIDGVQAEFNPEPSYCRETFSGHLYNCFVALQESMRHKGVDAVFVQNVKLTKKEMKRLSPEAQQFGCSPSENAHKEDNTISIKDASTYSYRSAGGHIHIGHENDRATVEAFKTPKDVIQLLDILVGNTCVLLDRDEGNIIRRKVYGKAGEYRVPAHGLEYRTLSNFWLRSYQMMSFVLGMVRFAVNIAASSPEAKAALFAAVDMEDIERAINQNDFKLAQRNFDNIKDIVSKIRAFEGSDYYPLEGRRIESFQWLVNKGLNHYFKEETVAHWTNSTNIGAYNRGWERFADEVLAADMPPILVEVEEPKQVVHHVLTGVINF